MGCPNVSGRSRSGVAVQTGQTQDHLGLIGPLGHQVAPAFSAEMPDFPGRRLEVAKKFLASTPFEASPLGPTGRRECCAVSLSARSAIAVENRSREPLSLECYRPTKTTSAKHFNVLLTPNHQAHLRSNGVANWPSSAPPCQIVKQPLSLDRNSLRLLPCLFVPECGQRQVAHGDGAKHKGRALCVGATAS